MNKLTKYTLTTCFSSLAFASLIVYATKTVAHPETYLFRAIFEIIAPLIYIAFPIFLIFMSAKYLFKEKEGYFKSLLISYPAAILFGTIINLFLNNLVGEQRLELIADTILSISILIISSLINFIILIKVKK